MSTRMLAHAAERARTEGCEAGWWLVANGHIEERRFYRLMAAALGLPYEERSPDTRGAPMLCHEAMAAREHARSTSGRVQVVPGARDVDLLRAAMAAGDTVRERVAITSPSLNKRAVRVERSRALLLNAVRHLREQAPDMSAHRVMSAGQWWFLALLVCAGTLMAVAAPFAALFAVHALASLFFLGCVLLRVWLVEPVQLMRSASREEARCDAALPTYSVLVTLYREENQADALVAALSRLDWPAAKLDIKLICERDDTATLAAIERCRPGAQFEVIRVPAHSVRTKPKALSYALPTVRGEYLVLYDAEDRPDPGQLREAHARFAAEDGSLACLQAPLLIDNADTSFFTRMFAIEYAVLFRGLLPALARMGAPMPLGGTSNHFRVRQLEAVGGWDAYNVTEDADLGIRIARAGLRAGVLTRPTFEEAPATFAVWLKQRTRWMKGWTQTMLIHLRSPLRLARELGPANLIAFLFFVPGLVFCGLAQLVFWGVVLWRIGWGVLFPETMGLDVLDLVDLTSVTTGYLAYGVVAWRVLGLGKRRDLRRMLIGLPVYWLMISLASWRALWQLVFDPFRWEKTPHGSSTRTSGVPAPGE